MTDSSATRRTTRPGPPASRAATETRRADVLRSLRVLDTDPEGGFDELTSLAAQLCGTPMAMVTFADQAREWFKSSVGIESPPTAVPAPDGSFCAQTILNDHPLVVPDARQDPRFAGHPLVAQGPGIRFYAGVPLVVDGCAIGSLCVMDTRPRVLSTGRLDQLEVLARQVVNQLELRSAGAQLARDVAALQQAENQIRRSEERFRFLFHHSPVGIAECRTDGTVLEVNDTMCRLLGFSPEEIRGRSSGDLLADDDERRRQSEDLHDLAPDAAYFTRRMFRRGDGSLVPVLLGVTVVADAAGDGPRLLATGVDLTQQTEAEARLALAHDEIRRRQILTEAVLDSIDVGIVACDEHGNITMFNRATKQWHGADVDGGVGRFALAEGVVGPDFNLFDVDGTRLTADRMPVLRALREGSVTGAEVVFTRADRPATRVQCTGRAMIGADGAVVGAVVAMTDVTAAQAQQQALLASETRFRATFDNDPAGLAVLTEDGHVVQANPALGRLLGLTDEQLRSLRSVTELVRPPERGQLTDLLRRAPQQPGQPVVGEHELIGSHGEPVWCLLTVMDLPDPQIGRCLLLQAEDITLRREAEQKLTRQAHHDSLTGLPNRARILDRIEAAVARRRRRGSRAAGQLYALFCDLDGFKAVNDSHGHAAGDHVLVEISRRLEASLRPSDLIGRLGGDEFLLVCDDVAEADAIADVARRVEAAVAQPVEWKGQRLRVSVSIGIARGDAATTAEQLVRNADLAMYHAKRRGKDRHELYDDSMRRRSTAQADMEAAIRRALEDGAVEAHYQPVVELDGHGVVGVEALARIRRPDGTLLLPGDFIPVAEDTGLIVPLGTFMLTSACAQVARWRTGTGRPLTLAVNLSARQAARPDLGTVVLDALASSGLPADALHLELTESVLLEADRATLEMLEQLRDKGVQIGIDDFGTGYASLRYLRHLPVSFLKVDREFVDRMTSSRDDEVIVRTVMRLAADLGLHCVVEGIETQEQLDMLAADHAFGQGYFFGRPADARTTSSLLEASGWGSPAPS